MSSISPSRAPRAAWRQRVRDRDRARVAVRLDGDRAQADQVRAAVGLGIDLVAQRAQLGSQQQPAELALPGRHRRLRGSRRSSQAPVPSSSFSTTLPVKPSVTTTSTGAERHVAALDVAREAQAGIVGEQAVGVDHEAVALALLVAVREQADARLVDAEHAGREGGAHVRELVQLVGPRIGRRADVEHDDRPLPRRQRLHDRRAQHARQAPQLEQPGGQHGAGRPGRDGGLGAALAHEAHACDDRGVGALARGARGLLVVRDHVGRVDDLDLRVVAHERLELRRVDRTAARAGLRAPPRRGPPHDHVRAPVAAHRVERDGDRGAHAPSGSISRPLYVLHVGHMRCARVGDPHCAQTPTAIAVRDALIAALVAAGLRGLLLRDGHAAGSRSGRAAARLQTAPAAAPSARPWAARSRTRRGCGRRRTAGRGRRSPRGSGSRCGSARIAASVAQRSTSSSSPARYGVVSSSSTSGIVGLVLARRSRRASARASSRQRWHGPTIVTSKARSKSRPPASRVRPSCAAHLVGLGAVLLRAGRERGDGDGHLLAGGSRRGRAAVCGGRRASSRAGYRGVAPGAARAGAIRRARARTARRSAAAAARGRAGRPSGTCRGSPRASPGSRRRSPRRRGAPRARAAGPRRAASGPGCSARRTTSCCEASRAARSRASSTMRSASRLASPSISWRSLTIQRACLISSGIVARIWSRISQISSRSIRTWSVSGTAFAPCTSSSSLSMRTRTSMRPPRG